MKNKNFNGIHINVHDKLQGLKRFAPKEHPIPRDPYTFHIKKLKKNKYKDCWTAYIAGILTATVFWMIIL